MPDVASVAEGTSEKFSLYLPPREFVEHCCEECRMARNLVFGVIILLHGFVDMPSFGPGFIPLSRDPFYKKFRFDAVRISGTTPLHAHIDALRNHRAASVTLSLFCQHFHHF
jgi:hypothetical protein